ncbi:hypothetical protein NIES2101_43020 [Calothrix sp. HK-06]|nr:hypothetical protein NIES2101_43020 [Calothrix sp. HK-06]
MLIPKPVPILHTAILRQLGSIVNVSTDVETTIGANGNTDTNTDTNTGRSTEVAPTVTLLLGTDIEPTTGATPTTSKQAPQIHMG